MTTNAGIDHRGELIGHLNTFALPGIDIATLRADIDLFAAGALDSLSFVQIILYLEARYGIDVGKARVDPSQLTNVRGILEVISRHFRD